MRPVIKNVSQLAIECMIKNWFGIDIFMETVPYRGDSPWVERVVHDSVNSEVWVFGLHIVISNVRKHYELQRRRKEGGRK